MISSTFVSENMAEMSARTIAYIKNAGLSQTYNETSNTPAHSKLC